jgi:hypothetical protein
MKITKEELRKLIYEQFFNTLNEDSRSHKVSIDEPVLKINENLNESFDIIEDQNLIKDSETKIQELKSINEEIKRMKQLVDFRSPLLSDNNL